MNDEQWWEHRLEAYVQWRSEVGGQRGEGAMRATQENLRSILGRWVRYTCNNEIDPTTYNELAIGQFCDAQDDIKDTTRADYRRHIRRWCERLPEFENTRPQRMAKLVAEFRETGYPTVKDNEHKRVRMQLEQILRSLPQISFEERDQVKDVWTTKKDQADFGGAGLGASTLNGTINQASPRSLLNNARWVGRVGCSSVGQWGPGWVVATKPLVREHLAVFVGRRQSCGAQCSADS